MGGTRHGRLVAADRGRRTAGGRPGRWWFDPELGPAGRQYRDALYAGMALLSVAWLGLWRHANSRTPAARALCRSACCGRFRSCSARRCSARTSTATWRRERSCTSGSIPYRARAGRPRDARPGARAERRRSVLAAHDRAVRAAVPVVVSVVAALTGSHLVVGRAADQARRAASGWCCSRCSCRGSRARSAPIPAARPGGGAQPARAARAGGGGAQRSVDDRSAGRRRHARHRAAAAGRHRGVRARGDDQAAGGGAVRSSPSRGCASAGYRRARGCAALAATARRSVAAVAASSASPPAGARTGSRPRCSRRPARCGSRSRRRPRSAGRCVAAARRRRRRAPARRVGARRVAFGAEPGASRCAAVAIAARTMVRNLGIALIAVAVGGPAAWPWYLTWGLVLLAASVPVPAQPRGARAGGRRRRARRQGRRHPGASRCTPRRCSWSCTSRSRRRSWSSRRAGDAAAAGAPLRPVAPRSPSPDGDADRASRQVRTPERAVRAPARAGGRLLTSPWWRGPAVLAIALCLYELTTRSLWLDEAATVAIAGQHGSALWHAIAHDGGNMLGYYALLHVLIGWFGDGAFVIRLPSVPRRRRGGGAVSLLALRAVRPAGRARRGLLDRGQPAARVLGAGRARVRGDGRRWSRDRSLAFAAIVDRAAPAGAVDRVRRPHHAVGVRELRRDLRGARAAGRAAPGAGRPGAARSALAVCAVCWSRSRCWRPTADRASCSGSRAPSLKAEKQVILSLYLGGLRAELPADRACAALLAIVTVLAGSWPPLAIVRGARRPVGLAAGAVLAGRAGGADVAVVADRAADLHAAQRARVAAGGGAAARLG